MDENTFLEKYDSSKYVTPDGYTSDMVIFTIVDKEIDGMGVPDKELKVMLILRDDKDTEGNPNVEGLKWAIPGGFVREDETALEAAARELLEETGVQGCQLAHFGVYDKPRRDPRGWVISNAHYAIVPENDLITMQANDDARDVQLFSWEQIDDLDLAFDHHEIIKDAFECLKRDILQTTVAKNFLEDEFTATELQKVLLTVTDRSSIKIKSVWMRNIQATPFIEKAINDEGDVKVTKKYSRRPSTLYRFKDNGDVPVVSIY
ncbi:NUDIX hydrolase [Salipaludibacillus sp. LMS25]|jgi:ADP-ribose pyrophosphatase YjhB (NUDIX family)|uniref:NUDIX domain-containing protein n=1 Tax=Salipaludibacillus sp. LMS25 TaxID=2924031 RepID=UPI0020D02643|nr:NUDIX hydrolase [Salipaludibacillus sp. LMS25]UTR13395.1 NUDIX hydrolase [Salipaludibacillus sp. LMS25]